MTTLGSYQIERTTMGTYVTDLIFPGRWRCSSLFGPRGPIPGAGIFVDTFHKGLDIPAAALTPIFAPVSGEIVIVDLNPNDGTGFHTQLRTDDGWLFVFGHLNINAPRLPANTRVKTGQFIGFVGTTGLSTGNHTHLEILPPEHIPATKPFGPDWPQQFDIYVGDDYSGHLDPLSDSARAYVNTARLTGKVPGSEPSLPLGIRALAQGYGYTRTPLHTETAERWLLEKAR